MKKMITILALAAALSITGCKKKDDAAAGSGSASATGSAAKVGEGSGSAPATGADPGSAPATGSAAASGTTDQAAAAAAGSTGSPECDEYLKTFDDVVAKCKDKLGPALDAMKTSRDSMAESFKGWGALDEASKKATIEAAATGCKSATESLKTSATSMGCTL